MLKNLNRYYDNAGRLDEVAPRVIDAYNLSKAYLGLTHDTTMMSRHLYYKVLLFDKNYPEAILLVQENISIVEDGEKGDFRRLHFLEQLATLYGLTKQFEKEEQVLVQFLEMSKKILDNTDEENSDIIIMQAQNYCRQKKMVKFEELVASHRLKYFCK